MFYVRSLAVLLCAGLLLGCFPAAASSNLVTGNGFGFAVVSPQTATVTRFYAHPYAFTRPDPNNSLSEGFPTANFIQVLGWGDGTATASSADYEEDSQIIHARSAGEGSFFMPFGLRQSALIISWQPGAGLCTGVVASLHDHSGFTLSGPKRMIHPVTLPSQVTSVMGASTNELWIETLH
jgi:hypothetical protein